MCRRFGGAAGNAPLPISIVVAGLCARVGIGVKPAPGSRGEAHAGCRDRPCAPVSAAVTRRRDRRARGAAGASARALPGGALGARWIEQRGRSAPPAVELRPERHAISGPVRAQFETFSKINFCRRRSRTGLFCVRTNFTVRSEHGGPPAGGGSGILAVAPAVGKGTDCLDEVVHRGEGAAPDRLVSEDSQRNLD